MPSRFYEQEVSARLKNKRRLSAFLDTLIYRHRPGIKKIQLTYIFCRDASLLDLNKQFLAHDTLTDIITFDLSEQETELKGEIYISTERVAENAVTFQTGYDQELHRVIFHGALHLCGFRDKNKAEQQEIRQQEDLCLKTYIPEQKA